MHDRSGDMCECWDAMNNMFRLQHCAIRASFERSTYMVQHRHNIPVYDKLRGYVSKNALIHIGLEYDRMNSIDIENFICGCKVRKIYGLPCACELVQYNRMSVVAIPLLVVHIHWRRVKFGDKKDNETDKLEEEDFAQEWDVLVERFRELDIAGKITLKSKVRDLAFSDTTSMCQAPIIEGEGPSTSGKGPYEEDLVHEWDALLKRFRELDIVSKVILKSKVHELAFPDTISTSQPQMMEDECPSISSNNPSIGHESVWEVSV